MNRHVNCWLIALLIAPLWFACAGPDKKTNLQTSIDWQRVTTAEALEQLQEEQKTIRSFSAGFSVIVDPPPKGYPANLQGLIYFARDGEDVRLRVRGLAPFGRTVFDLVQDKERIELYLPSEKTLYRGKPGDGADSPWARIFSFLFVDFARFQASSTENLKVMDSTVLLPLDPGELVVNRASGLPMEVRTGGGSIHFSQYRHQPGLPSVPLRIKIVREGGHSTALCRFSQVALNQDLSAVFDLSAYQPEQIREMRDMEAHR